MPYTILLVGGTGVGKSSVVEFIANVLFGRDTDNYDFDILDHANEQGDSGDRSQTKGVRLYEFTSINGIVVSFSALDLVGRCNLFPRFVSLTHPDSPRPAMSSKTSSTRRGSPIRSENKSTLSLPSSFSLIVPSRATLSGWTARSPPCPTSSPIH